jgi:hypothetical protein
MYAEQIERLSETWLAEDSARVADEVRDAQDRADQLQEAK